MKNKETLCGLRLIVQCLRGGKDHSELKKKNKNKQSLTQLLKNTYSWITGQSGIQSNQILMYQMRMNNFLSYCKEGKVYKAMREVKISLF